ncbi:MAG: ATP synthase subunit I [Betaproteobacteria bacterium]|nr:ATP synthase subunit I [Betaproteobacteria bacterium]
MLVALSVQAGLVITASLLVWSSLGAPVAVAVAYGGVVALANSGLLVWRWHRGRKEFHCDSGRHMKGFHRSALERFFVVGILLAAGMAGSRLGPLAMLVGFTVGQLSWVVLVSGLQRN